MLKKMLSRVTRQEEENTVPWQRVFPLVHVPSAWHVREDVPCKENPVLQLKVIVLGYVVELPWAKPCSGIAKRPQSTAGRNKVINDWGMNFGSRKRTSFKLCPDERHASNLNQRGVE